MEAFASSSFSKQKANICWLKMKLTELFSKLEKSSEFKKFHKANPKAYFCAAFFVFDYQKNADAFLGCPKIEQGSDFRHEQKEDKIQMDYCISENDIETFVIADKVMQQKAQMAQPEKLKEIKKDEIKVDLPEVIEIVRKEAEKSKFIMSKLIVILQRLKESEQLIWNITAFSGFNLLRMHIAMDKKLLLNEKKSMMDLMKIEKGSKSKGSGSTSKPDDTKPPSGGVTYCG